MTHTSDRYSRTATPAPEAGNTAGDTVGDNERNISDPGSVQGTGAAWPETGAAFHGSESIRRLHGAGARESADRWVGDSQMTSERARQPDWWGRGVGLVVFFLGIVLLVMVFIWTNQQLPAAAFRPGQKWDEWASQFGVQVVRLFVSGLVASWIAGRGAQLYAAANRALSGD